MRVRTLLPALAITVAGLGVGTAAPAVAAPASAAQVSAVQQAQGHDVYRGWYLNEGNCKTAGKAGVDRGHWDSFSCAPGRGGFLWHLWSNR
ncbi:hypothetical protein ACH4TV_46265 [Streptomyces sp. NPDC020898]|uniref:hypothetical protein n=1 Tax=Streptomyces sp. NPDC020898 TaxID=3365101 RepID=UPI0037B91F6D